MKVLIIDDQRLFVDGIQKLIKDHDPDIKSEYAGNVFSAYEKINDIESPDLILLSINDNASANSFDLIDRMIMQNINIPVIVISTIDSTTVAALAIEHNASGFITKSCRRRTTLKAILAVLEGNMYVRKPKYQAPFEMQVNNEGRVTSRQQEVLYLLSQGLLNKQIASELDISANTVKAHLHELFRRLDVSNRTAAVQHGYNSGLI